MDKIEVLELRAVQRGNLKALASVRLGDIVIHDFRVVQQPGQRAWVGEPAASWETETGGRAYRLVVELPKPLRKEIERAVLDAWEESMN